MRIFLVFGLICLMSSSASSASESRHTLTDYCGNIADDMATVYFDIVERIRQGYVSKPITVNSSIIFQGFVKSYELAGCDGSEWRGKVIEVERKLRSDD